MAISAATRNVLSPISEKMIIVNESIKECMGEMTAGSCSSGFLGVVGFSEESMSSFGEDGFSGWGISCGFEGRSSGTCEHVLSLDPSHQSVRVVVVLLPGIS